MSVCYKYACIVAIWVILLCSFCQQFRNLRRLTSNDYIVTSALRDYEQTWRDEQELNKQFQCFITNFKFAYEGRVNQRMNNKYSDIIERDGHSLLKTCTQNNLNLKSVHNVNTILPTGASFRAMVDWFAKDINYR